MKPDPPLALSASSSHSFDTGDSENPQSKSSRSSDNIGHKFSISVGDESVSVVSPSNWDSTVCACPQSSNRRVACVTLGDLVSSVMRAGIGKWESTIIEVFGDRRYSLFSSDLCIHETNDILIWPRV
jgi:hypothetical protein